MNTETMQTSTAVSAGGSSRNSLRLRKKRFADLRVNTTSDCDDIISSTPSPKTIVTIVPKTTDDEFFSTLCTELPGKYLKKRKSLVSVQYDPIRMTYINNPYCIHHSVQLVY